MIEKEDIKSINKESNQIKKRLLDFLDCNGIKDALLLVKTINNLITMKEELK